MESAANKEYLFTILGTDSNDLSILAESVDWYKEIRDWFGHTAYTTTAEKTVAATAAPFSGSPVEPIML